MSHCAALLLLGLLAGAEARPLTDRHGDPLPDGAIARLGTSRQRIAATQLALSADGQILVTVAAGRAVARWDVPTGRMREYRLLPGNPTDTFWLSPDGRLLAVAEEGRLAVYDTETGACKRRLPGWTNHVAFRPDGKGLATSTTGPSDAPCRVRLWDLASGEDRLVAELPSGYVNILAFHPDGKKLFVEVSDYSIRCWDIASRKEIWNNRSGARHLAISPDGRMLCSDSYSDSDLNLWDTATGRRIGRGPSGIQALLSRRLAFAPDGRTVFLSDEKDILLWDTAKGTVRNRLGGAGPCFALSADGKTLVSLAGSLLRRWEVHTRRPLYSDTADHGHTDAIRGVTFAPDGRGVVTAGADGTLRYWDRAERPRTLLTDLPESRGARRFNSPNSWRMVYSPPFLAVTGDGRGVLSDTGQGELRWTDIRTGEKGRCFDVRGQDKTIYLDTACLSTDGRRLWGLTYQRRDTGGGSAELKSKSLVAWDMETGRRLSVQHSPGTPHDNVIAPDGRFVAGEYGGVCDAASGESCLKGERAWLAAPYAFSTDSRLVAGVADPQDWSALAVYELLTGRSLLRVAARVDWSSRLAFSPDGRLLLAAGRDALHVWEVSTGRRLLHLPAANRLPAWVPGSFANCLAVAPDGQSAATGHDDGTVLLWDLAPAWRRMTGRPVALLMAAHLDACWDDLIHDDPRTAYAAMKRLSAAPAGVVGFLRKHLKPVTVEPSWLTNRLAALDSPDFAVREKASRDLEGVAEAVEPRLRREMERTASAEVRGRLRRILEVPRPLVPPAETIRQLRAVALLERLGSAEARALLGDLAKGESAARLTIAADEALGRLAAVEARRKTAR